MVVLGVTVFATAIGFDTAAQSTFDLPKLAIVQGAASLLLVAFAARAALRGEAVLARTACDWPVLATVVVAVAATVWSVDWRCSLFGAYKTYGGLTQIVATVILFYAAARLRRREVVVVVGMVIMAAVAAGAYGLVQAIGLDPLGWSKVTPGREIATFGNPVFYGMYLGLAAPLALGLAFHSSRCERGGGGVVAGWAAALVAAPLLVTQVYIAGTQVFRGAESTGSGVRAAVLVAGAVVLCIALAALPLRGRELPWPASLAWLMVAVTLGLNAACYTSRTVGALIALLLAMAWFVAHLAWRRRDSLRVHRWRWLVVAVGVVAIHVGLNLWSRTTVFDRIAQMVFRDPAVTAVAPSAEPRQVGPGGTLYMRDLLFRTGWNIFRAYPLLGVGPDAVERVVATHWSADYQLAYGRLVEVEGFENRLHNEILEIAATQGAAGVAARLWLYGTVLLLLWRGSRRVADDHLPLLAGLGAAWVYVTLANLVEYPTIPLAATHWILLGCLVAWVDNGSDETVWPLRRLPLERVNRLVLVVAAVAVTVVVAVAWVLGVARPYRADLLFMVGQMEQRGGRVAAARAAYEATLALAPEQNVYRETLESLLLAQLTPLATRSDGAALAERETLARTIIALAADGLRWNPWRANGFTLLGMADDLLADALAARQGGGSAEVTALRRTSFELLERALEVNPHNAQLRTVLARQCAKHGRRDQLVRTAEGLLALWPKSQPIQQLLLQVASRDLAEGRPAEAVALLARFVEVARGPAAVELRVALGRAYGASRQWAELDQQAAAILAVAPDHLEGHRLRAVAAVEQGRWEDAEAVARRLLALAPDDAWAAKVVAVARARGVAPAGA